MPEQLSAVQARELSHRGEAVVVDLRRPAEFARGHPKSAINLPYSEKGLPARLAIVLPPGTPVMLLASEPATAAAGLAQLRTSQYPVLGLIEPGAWQEAGLAEESFPEIPIQTLAKAVPGRDLTILDVREPMEWETGHVPGALLVSLGNLRERLSSIPGDAPIAVICESGVRSSTAASILQAAGFSRVANVPAGTSGYRRAGLPLEFPENELQGTESV